jgi:16S rRNA processing protein RimM
VNLDNLAVLGHTMKPHGLKGALKVRLTSGAIPQIAINEPVFILLQGGPVPFFVEEKPDVSRSTIVLKLEGIDSIDAAEGFVGKEVLIQPDRLEWEEETGLNALIGYSVHDLNLGDIGTVTGVMELPQQSILEILHKGKEVLIPAVEGIIQGIDPKKKQIVVETPEGLVDLYLHG